MHSQVLIKVKADDADEARAIVQEVLDETCADESTGWDFVGGISQVVKKVTDSKTQTYLGSIKSFEELEEHWKNATLHNKKRYVSECQDILFIGLMDVLMPPDEAPLYLDKKNHYGNEIPQFKEKLEYILKNNFDNPNKGLSYEELINRMTYFITNNKDSMFYYYLKCINKINTYLEYPDKYNALYHSSDVHFFDMTQEQEKDGIPDDSKVFYFLTDRHC